MVDKFLDSKRIKHIQDTINYSWLNLPEEEFLHPILSPFGFDNKEFITDPHLYVLKLMKNPDYFYFTCKYIFNLEILPLHLAVLKALWTHKYPMMLGSRGFGKCIEGDSFVMHNNGISTIKELVGPANPGDKNYYKNVYCQNESANFNEIEYGWNNGLTPIKKIESSQGFQLGGTYDHPIRIVRDKEIKWVELQDVRIGDYVVIDRSEIWFENSKHIDDDLAYLFGLLVGDGGYTVKSRISFTSADEQLHIIVNNLMHKYFGKETVPSSDEYTKILYSTETRRLLFDKYGFNSSECSEKSFPKCILQGPKSAAAAFIKGLFDTDGHCLKNLKGLEYCSKSRELVRTLQYVLTKFGIVSRMKKRLNKKYNRNYYYLYIFGQEVNKFHDKIGFGLNSKQARLIEAVKVKSNTNKDILPTELIYETMKENRLLKLLSGRKNISFDLAKQIPCLNKFTERDYYYDKVTAIEDGEAITYDIHCKGDDHSFNSNGFVSHNTFYLAVYSMIKALFCQNSKIVVVGAGFRQAKYVFNYCETIWNNAPILRSLVGNTNLNGPKKDTDRWEMRLGTSRITALPMGPDGSKIRGERATCIISDEFSSINYQVYQTVVQAFASVRANPSKNAQHVAKVKRLKELGQWTEEDEKEELIRNLGNQAIIAGTPTYQSNHFYREWLRYKKIIESKGEPDKVKELCGDDSEFFDYRDYCIIRIPFKLIPEGFMDESHIARSKVTMDIGIYNMEFGACFNVDSSGFFKKSLIDGCTSPVELTEGTVSFSPMICGNPNKKYVFAIDAASEADNFSIVILEVHPTHRRVVYCWTTNKISFRDRIEQKLTQETSFYAYCARKIRDLAKLFPTELIAYDTQGGGYAVEEALHDASKLLPGEQLWWQAIEEDKEKPTDDYPGLHILYPVQMASAEYTLNANHDLKKDMSGKQLIFPLVDSISYVEAAESDKEQNRVFDTMEDCVWEIEQLKEELTTIVHTVTDGGRDKWSTPEYKMNNGKKGKLRKDRYSSLLMANALGRKGMFDIKVEKQVSCGGGFANQFKKIDSGQPDYIAPQWFTSPDYSQVYG